MQKGSYMHIKVFNLRIYNLACVWPIALTFGTRTFLYNHTNKRGVFNLITYSQMKLCLMKAARSDVCKRSLFANPVTYEIFLYGLMLSYIHLYIVDVSELFETVLSARSALIDLLTTALMGDKLAAEYMLLNLISTVWVVLFEYVNNGTDYTYIHLQQ